MPGPRSAQTPSRPSTLPGYGLPQERLAQIAARHVFVDVKQCFARCIDSLDPGAPLTDWLAREVRRAQEPAQLWTLRCAMFAALRRDRVAAPLITRLRHALAALFPAQFEASGFADSLD